MGNLSSFLLNKLEKTITEVVEIEQYTQNHLTPKTNLGVQNKKLYICRKIETRI